ncbi:PH domain-containing protein [Cryptosporidium andersoni]|uniref:PH domain-containing protein n=1 Tax=Cryptosporidium andersoni TaxID=117008 RepID=A0A1J4MTP0_9CRYT|nr:PH domain-containing protein [Cryptosporidium andersoni]
MKESVYRMIERGERSASIVQELIENEYVSGYLKKWSPVIGRGWQSRYFSLLEKDRTLIYWIRKPTYRDEQPKGSINLKVVENVFADGPLGITLSTPQRDYQLRASTPTEKDKWMDAIILWTLKSRKMRSRTEDTRNFRFSNLLVDATQSCFHYIVESLLKPFKKSATRAIEVGPETLSNSNKRRFLKDRGLYDVIMKAWEISKEIIAQNENNVKIIGDKIIESNSLDIYCQGGNRVNYKTIIEEVDLSLNTCGNEISSRHVSEVPIADERCPLTLEEEIEYVRNNQHKYSIQLADIMLQQLSASSKDAFLDNCTFGLIYIRRENSILPFFNNGVFWGLLICSRPLSDAHHPYPSSTLGERTILGTNFEQYKYISFEINSGGLDSLLRNPSLYPNEGFNHLLSEENKKSAKSLSFMTAFPSRYTHSSISTTTQIAYLGHKTASGSSIYRTNYLIRKFSPHGECQQLSSDKSSTIADPYNFALDTLYLYYPRSDSKSPVEILNPGSIVALGPILETIHGFCFEVTFLVVNPKKKHFLQDLNFISDYVSDIPIYMHNNKEDFGEYTDEDSDGDTEFEEIPIQLCTRSWRDARAWRYTLLVARRSQIVNSTNISSSPSMKSPKTKSSVEVTNLVEESGCKLSTNYFGSESYATLTTNASNSARTSNGQYLTVNEKLNVKSVDIINK